jgi:hypothetical protein
MSKCKLEKISELVIRPWLLPPLLVAMQPAMQHLEGSKDLLLSSDNNSLI